MQFIGDYNPFMRLKHYKPDMCDPKENHATESLAACLHFSANLKIAFLKLLSVTEHETVLAQAEVTTQEPMNDGLIDLYLSKPGHFHVGVEVKINALEDERHKRQMLRYSQCLSKKEPPGKLLSLVRSPTNFDFKNCGISKRITWRDVHECFKRQAQSGGTDAELAAAFCDYLQKEGIVMNYDVATLCQYAIGIKAQTALDGTFTQVTDTLAGEGYETNIQSRRKDRWPKLEIRNDRWKTVFGEGENYKINIWFCVPQIWDATEHGFLFSLEIWNEEYPNDWKFICPRLPRWLDTLNKAGLHYNVWNTWREEGQTDVSAERITACPVRISASYNDHRDIGEQEIKKFSQEDLVRWLVDRTHRFSELIEQLR
jgi:hypothetical protein